MKQRFFQWVFLMIAGAFGLETGSPEAYAAGSGGMWIAPTLSMDRQGCVVRVNPEHTLIRARGGGVEKTSLTRIQYWKYRKEKAQPVRQGELEIDFSERRVRHRQVPEESCPLEVVQLSEDRLQYRSHCQKGTSQGSGDLAYDTDIRFDLNANTHELLDFRVLSEEYVGRGVSRNSHGNSWSRRAYVEHHCVAEGAELRTVLAEGTYRLKPLTGSPIQVDLLFRRRNAETDLPLGAFVSVRQGTDGLYDGLVVWRNNRLMVPAALKNPSQPVALILAVDGWLTSEQTLEEGLQASLMIWRADISDYETYEGLLQKFAP